MNKLQELTENISAKRRELAGIIETGGEELNLDADQVSQIKQLNDEIEDLCTQREPLADADTIARKNREAMERDGRVTNLPGHSAGKSEAPKAEAKSIGELFVDSPAFKEYSSARGQGPNGQVDADVKTLMTTSAGFAPQAIRTGQVIDSAQQQPRIVDVIPAITTDQTAVVFMQETTFTNAAAETAEGGTYPEAALAYTEANSPVRKISVFLPVTDEQLTDIKGMQDRLNNRLTLMMRQRIDQQIVAGDGNAPNLKGILNTSGILTQARATDVNVDALYKAVVKLQSTGFVEPNAYLMHPLDWQNIRLLRTADGMYIFGFPSETGADRLWGLPVVKSTYVTQGTAISGDFAGFTELAYKAGLEFEVSNSHSDYFAKGQLAIRAQLRAALVILRPSAMCSITGL